MKSTDITNVRTINKRTIRYVGSANLVIHPLPHKIHNNNMPLQIDVCLGCVN